MNFKLFKPLLDLIFPIYCISCKKEGNWLCKKCSDGLRTKDFQTCPLCSKQNKTGKFCKKCKNKNLNGILITGEYENYLLKSLIKQYKYKFTKEISTHLGDFLYLFLKQIKKENHPIFKEEYLITAVPLHKKRQNWRGFNQSEELAKIISKKMDVKMESSLKRIKNTDPQATLNKEERTTNIKNCFKWQGEKIHNKNILIIDDVTTTGSTIEECAKEFKKQGAKNIWALVVAKN